MTVIVFVRHSEDAQYCNRKHDCDLKSEGKSLAKSEGRRIIRKYGVPSVIYVSPFRRTLQTMEGMLSSLESRDRSEIEIIKDNQLCRYFSSSEKLNPRVHSETYEEQIPIQETFSEFKRRVSHFNERIKSVARRRNNEDVIWCITHALVYKRLARFNSKRIPKHIPFMHSFTIEWCEDCKAYH